jgi:hypothetical protein
MSADEVPADASAAKMAASDLGELSPDSSLAVGNNVTLTLQSDALFVNGMYESNLCSPATALTFPHCFVTTYKQSRVLTRF